MKTLKVLLQDVVSGIKAWATANFSNETHVHGNVSNTGKLATASKALITDSNKNITTSSVSDTELGYLSGVTSAIQTQLNAKAADSDVVHKTGNETVGGIKTFTQIIKNKSENFEIGVIPSSTIGTGYHILDKNNVIVANLFYNQYSSGNSQFGLNLRTKDNNNNIVNKSVLLATDQYGTWYSFRPSSDGEISLGTSAYQWNNAYIKSLTINGVACGDILTHNVSEFVDVSSNQTIGGIKTFTSSPKVIRTNDPFYYLFTTGYVKGTNPASNMYSGIRFHCNPDAAVSNKITGGLDMTYYASGYNAIGLNVRNYDENSNQRFFTVSLRVSSDSTLPPDLVPSVSGQINLGASINKWKTLWTNGINGVNPGALSLPDYAKSANIDTTNWNTTGTKIDYTPPENCLIQIVTHNESGNKITVLNKYTSPEWGNCVCGNGQGNNLFFEKLLEGGRTYYIYITDTNASPTVRARYVPLFGNV